jgi:hypothetical protein
MAQPPRINGPGIYTQDVPSGSQTIVGVPTSVTAFVGRFASGPVGTPILVSDYASAVSMAGGILPDSPVTYALRDFFLNGGKQALIVRIFGAGASSGSSGTAVVSGPAPSNLAAGTAFYTPTAADPFTLTGASLIASSPGDWGNGLAVMITQTDKTVASASRYSSLGIDVDQLFDVTVKYTPDASQPNRFATETIGAVTFVPGTRQIDRVLAQSSEYLRLSGPVSAQGGITAPAQTVPPTLPGAATWTGVSLGGGSASPALQATDYLDAQVGFAAVLKQAAIYNILVIPPDQFGHAYPPGVLQNAGALCSESCAFLLVEPPPSWTDAAEHGEVGTGIRITDISELEGPTGEYAAVYFPNALFPGQPSPYPLSGIIAGIYAQTDATRGVWKAPAGVSATITGSPGLAVSLDGEDRETLNAQGINALLFAPDVGTVVWGARTMNGADVLGSEYKYVPVRRLTNYIKASVLLGTQWVVFEPNDDALWARLRLAIGTFMGSLFNQGAFAGTTATDAWFVRCDATTTTPSDQAAGVVNVVIGFAPVMPAEFIVLSLQQPCASAS